MARVTFRGRRHIYSVLTSYMSYSKTPISLIDRRLAWVTNIVRFDLSTVGRNRKMRKDLT